MVGQFQNQPNEEQAKRIAEICNQKGISKQDLANIINQLKGYK